MNARTLIEAEVDKTTEERRIAAVLQNADWSSDGEEFQQEAEERCGEEASQEEKDAYAWKLARSAAEEYLSDFQYVWDDLLDPIPIFRVITVLGDTQAQMIHSIRTENLGVCWSWDEQAAAAHHGNFDEGYAKVALLSEVPKSGVDEDTTFVLNSELCHVLRDEREIRVLKGTPLRVTHVRIGGKWVRTSIKGQA